MQTDSRLTATKGCVGVGSQISSYFWPLVRQGRGATLNRRAIPLLLAISTSRSNSHQLVLLIVRLNRIGQVDPDTRITGQ